MVTPQLVEYIKKTLGQGYPADKVREALVKKGWVAGDVDEAFRIAKGEPRPSVATSEALAKGVASSEGGSRSSSPATNTPAEALVRIAASGNAFQQAGGSTAAPVQASVSAQAASPRVQTPALQATPPLSRPAVPMGSAASAGSGAPRPITPPMGVEQSRPSIPVSEAPMSQGSATGDATRQTPMYRATVPLQAIMGADRPGDAQRPLAAPANIPVRPAEKAAGGAQSAHSDAEDAAASSSSHASEKKSSSLKTIISILVGVLFIGVAYVYFGSVYGIYAFGYNLFPFENVAERVTLLAEKIGLAPSAEAPTPSESAQTAQPTPTQTPQPTPQPTAEPTISPQVVMKPVRAIGVKAEARTIGALAYAPNRMRVAYSLLTGTPNLWIMDVASGEKEDVLRTGSVTLSGDAAPVVIAWSPDGSRLAVVARGGNTVADLYVITLADKSVVKVSAASGALDSVSTDPMLKPEWAHDGQWMLAYIGQDLVRVSADGKQVMRITAGLPFGAFDLAPDDSAITYAIRRDADERVWIMDADGKNYRALTPAGTSRAPQFNPAGTQIFYVSRDAAAAQDTMWSINRDGSNPQQLAVVSGTIREFQLSPDGSRILFIEKSANGTQRLRIMRTNGLGLEDILTGGAYEPMGFAAWNQSGTAVLVAGMEEFLMEVEL